MNSDSTNSRLYDPQREFSHTVDIQARFADFDMFGHVNNNSYMAYFDLGKSHFFDSIMGCPCTPDRLGAVIVNINVDFLAPAIAAEPLRVDTLVDKLGQHSFRLYQRVVNPTTGSVKAQATTTLAGFNPATQSSGPLLPGLVNALAKHAPNR